MQIRLSRVDALSVRTEIFKAGIHGEDEKLRKIGAELTKDIRNAKGPYIMLEIPPDIFRELNLASTEVALVGV